MLHRFEGEGFQPDGLIWPEITLGWVSARASAPRRPEQTSAGGTNAAGGT
jgi:hypothetical protein